MEPFVLDVGREGLCVEGYNDKGKTSRASAVMSGLSGHRLVSQLGPVIEVNQGQPLYSPAADNGEVSEPV